MQREVRILHPIQVGDVGGSLGESPTAEPRPDEARETRPGGSGTATRARYPGDAENLRGRIRNRLGRWAPAPARTPGPVLLQVVLQLAAAGWVAELAQRLGLDLADPLAGDVELLAHFLERSGTPVLETEPELQHPPLASGQ